MSKLRLDLGSLTGEYYAIVPLDNVCIVRNIAYRFRFCGDLCYNDTPFSYVPAPKVIEVNLNNRALKRFDDDWALGRYVALLTLFVTENGRRRFGGKRVADALNKILVSEENVVSKNHLHLTTANMSAINSLLKGDPSVTDEQRKMALAILEGSYKLPNTDSPASRLKNRGRLLSGVEAAKLIGKTVQTLHKYRRKGLIKGFTAPGTKQVTGYWEADVLAFGATM